MIKCEEDTNGASDTAHKEKLQPKKCNVALSIMYEPAVKCIPGRSRAPRHSRCSVLRFYNFRILSDRVPIYIIKTANPLA